MPSSQRSSGCIFRRSLNRRRLVHKPRCRSYALVSALPIICLARSGWGQNWINPSGGSYENPANWAGDAIPENPVFNLSTGVPYTVNMPKSDGGDNVYVSGTSVAIDISPGQYLGVVAGLYVNASAGQTTNFTFNGVAPYGADGTALRVLGLPNGDYPGGVGGGGNISFTINNSNVSIGSELYNFSAGTTVNFNYSKITAGMEFSGTATFNASEFYGGAENFGCNIGVYGPSNSPAVLNLLNGSGIDSDADIVIGANNEYFPQNTGTGVVNVAASQLSTGLYGNYGAISMGTYGGIGSLSLSAGSLADTQLIQIGSGVDPYFASSGGPGTLNVTGAGTIAEASQLLILGKGGTVQVSADAKVTAAQFNLSSHSTVQIALDAPDAIAVSGAALFAGTLDVTLGTAADPTLGNSYDLFTFGSDTGTFSSINLPPLDPGLAWNTQNLYTTGTITVVAAVPEPAMGFVALAACGLLTRRRSRAASEGGGTSDKELRPLRPL